MKKETERLLETFVAGFYFLGLLNNLSEEDLADLIKMGQACERIKKRNTFPL